MIKLVVSDIDGTLLEDGGHELNPELFDVILKLRAAGMQFAAASGRQWASIEAVFEPIKEKYFICRIMELMLECAAEICF